jgi:hypothetical protein
VRANPTDIVKRKPFESVALTTFGKLERVFVRKRDVREGRVNYLGHVIDLNDFGRKLYYLSCKIRVFALSLGEYGLAKKSKLLMTHLSLASCQTAGVL